MKRVRRIITRICILFAAVGISSLIGYAITNQLKTTTVIQSAILAEPTDVTLDHECTDIGTFRVIADVPLANPPYDDYNRPITENLEEDEVYCISPGTPLPTTGETIASLTALTGTYSIKHDTRYEHATDPPHVTRNTSGRYESWYNGYKFSDPYYYCSNDHVTQDSIIENIYTGQDVNTYDVAYIVSFYPIAVVNYQNASLDRDNWADFKQYAVWKSSLAVKKLPASRIESIRQKDPSIISSGESLIRQSLVYQEMTEGIKATTYTSEKYTTKDGEVKTYQKEADSMVIPHTDEELEELKDNLKVDTDLETNMYKVGPFTLNYVFGFNSEISIPTDPDATAATVSQYAMSGISDMYLEYIDENGQAQRIDIDVFIRPTYESKYNPNQSLSNPKAGLSMGGEYATPAFWSYYSLIGEENLNKVDWWCYNAFRNYPAPNEEFYVEFDFEGTLPASLKLKVEYEYLAIDFLACRRQGTIYYLYESSHSHKNCRSSTATRPHRHGYCRQNISLSSEEIAQPLVYVDYYRYTVKNYYEIPFETVGATSMKIGGYVFEDYPQGKEELADGAFDDQTDLVLPNVEVTLYVADENGEIKLDANGNEVLAELYTLEEEYPELTSTELDAIRSADDYKRRINPTLTDAYGYYEFRGVKQGQKYIVKFTYNGQTYMPTEYLTNLSENYSYESVAQMVDAGVYDEANPYFERWRETSKGLEKASERESFTNRFVEIASYPKGNTSTNS